MKKLSNRIATIGVFAALVLITFALLLLMPGEAAEETSASASAPAPTPTAASATSEAEEIPGPPIDYGLPVIEINVASGEYPDSGYKEITFEATMKIWDSKTNPSGGALYDGHITLKPRGTSSYLFSPKKSWTIKLSLNQRLLSLPSSSKDWVLISNYSDPSLMRSYLAYSLAQDIGDYATSSVFVDVLLNGEYIGNYSLGEKIELEKDRLGKGGYLLEITETTRALGDGEQPFFTKYVSDAACYIVCEPSKNDITETETTYISKYMQNFENVLYGANFCDKTNGWKSIIDAQSVADWYIINELFKNCDGFEFSTFFYKPDDGLMRFEPVWDFDTSSGMDFWGFHKDELEPIGFYVKERGYLPRMFEDPEFEALVKSRWQEIYKNALPQMFERINNTAALLRTSNEQNFALWHIFGENSTRKNYQEEVQYLTYWLYTRAEWLNTQWG